MESEILFASLSREPGFPITVPCTQFADYHRGTGTGLLISEQIHFGADGIERQYHKCLDYEMPEPLNHYHALTVPNFEISVKASRSTPIGQILAASSRRRLKPAWRNTKYSCKESSGKRV